MTDLSVTYNYTATGKAASDQTDQNFSDLVNYINARNSGTLPWDDLIVKGPLPWADVRGWGAVGDGVTNDREAIQDAIDAVQGIGGGVVFFPPLNFAIGNILYVPSNVTLKGSGMGASTISALSGTFPQNTSLIQLSQISGTLYTPGAPGVNITLEDLKFDCTGMAAATVDGAGQGVFVPNIQYFLIRRCHIKSSQSYGIHLAADSGTYGTVSPHIIHCVLEDCGVRNDQDTIGGGYNTGAVIAFNIMLMPNGTAIDNVHVENALWIGNRSVGASGHNGQIWSDFGMKKSRIIANYIENGSIHVYGFLGGGGQEAPSDVLIEGNHIVNGGSAAIYVSAANQVNTDTGEAVGMRIIGNKIEGCIDDGIVLEDAPNAIVTGNVISNWDTSGGGADAAIELRGGPNTALGSKGCVIGGNSGVVGGTTLYYNESTASQTGNNIVYGNNFPTGTVTLDSGGTVSSFIIETPSTLKRAVTVTPTSNQLILGTTRTVTVTAPTPASSSRILTIPDLSGDYSILGTIGNQSATGVKSFDGQLIGKGTATNDSAAAGYIGEFSSGTQTSNTNFPTSGELGDLASVSLTAGDWDVSGAIYATLNGSTITEYRVGISITSGNDSTGLILGDNYLSAVPPTATSDTGQSMPNVRISLSGTTTVYLKYIAFYASGAPQARGTIRARRRR